MKDEKTLTKINEIDIYKFIPHQSTLSIVQIVSIFLEIAKTERQQLLHDYLSVGDQSSLPIRQFILDVLGKVKELVFVYHFKKYHENRGIDESLHQDDYIKALCEKPLYENTDLKNVVELFVAWLKEEAHIESSLKYITVKFQNPTDIFNHQEILILRLAESNTEEIRKTRKRKFDELSSELKSSNPGFKQMQARFTQFFLDNSEVSPALLSIFKSLIANTFLYLFNLKINSNFSSQALLFNDSCFSLTSSSVTELPPPSKSLEAHTYINSIVFYPHGLEIITENNEQNIQVVVNDFNLIKEDYITAILNDDQYSIIIENHKKIIEYYYRQGQDPKVIYESSGLDFDIVCKAYQIDVKQSSTQNKL